MTGEKATDKVVDPALKEALRKLRYHKHWGGETWWVPAFREECVCLPYREAIALHRLLKEHGLDDQP